MNSVEVPSRVQPRENLALLLRQNVASAQAVYSYQPHSFNSQSPVVFLTSSGSYRPRMTSQGLRSTIFITVHMVVLYQDKSGGFTTDDADSVLDNIEAEVSTVLASFPTGPSWKALKASDRSRADDPLILSGDLYFHEVLPLELEV